MKLVLLSPKGPLYTHKGGIFKKNLRSAPLTLTTLAAYVPPELGFDIELQDEGIQDIDLDLEADLVGMTVMTGTAMRAYELAAHYRKRGIKVVLGGPHVTLLPEEAQQHADAIVTGYAEQTWPQLLRDFVNGEMKPRYDMAPDFNLDIVRNLPFPRRDLLPRNAYIASDTFEATRGCIHSCDFCVVPAAWGTNPFHKPIDHVIADIKQSGAKKFVFFDLNLIADKSYAKELFRELAKLNVQWYGLATTLMAFDDELLSLAAKSGCRGLLLGFESISPSTLRDANKTFNSPKRFKEVVENMHAHKISVNGTFVFGLDADTKDSFDATAEFVIDAKIDLPRFAIVTPFPNTGLYKRLKAEDRILTENWSLYDGQHVVFQPKNMTVDELQTGHERTWRKVYSFGGIAKRITGNSNLPLMLATNLGYRFYAYRLHKFYNCHVGAMN